MERSEKVKVISNHFFMQQFDNRPHSEVLEQMQEWAIKGWLSVAFIDECHRAIEDGKQVEITYDPASPSYGYLSGTPEAFQAFAKNKAPMKFVDKNGKEI